MRSSLRLLVPALVLAVVASACGSARAPAATVEGQAISVQQLSRDMVFFRFLSGLSQQGCGTAIAGESAESACARFTLSNLIQEDLVKGYAQRHDVTVPETGVTDALSRLESSVGGASNLDERLEAAGMTRDDLAALARRLLLFNEVQKAVAAERVTEAQLQQVYQQQLASFTQLDVAHILVDTQAQAERIARRATPRDFAGLAKELSTDTASARNGGDLGAVTLAAFQQTYDPDFVQATLKLTPGEISGPVQTRFGWHVIYLVSRTLQPFDQVRDQLTSQVQGQVFSTWLRERLAGADISVNPRYGRLDRRTGQVVPVRSTATESSTESSTPTP